jgi:hypothetical protein
VLVNSIRLLLDSEEQRLISELRSLGFDSDEEVVRCAAHVIWAEEGECLPTLPSMKSFIVSQP